MDYEQVSRQLVMAMVQISVAIDIGLGDDATYLSELVNYGIPVLAVEPLPSPGVRATCMRLGIPLEEVAISDTDGYATMYLGQFKGSPCKNLSSLHADWWGSSQETQQVPTMRLDTLLKKHDIKSVSILKIDTEGSELTIIGQLPSLPKAMLPAVVQFEYGGGAPQSTHSCGWNEKYFGLTCGCLQILQSLGYAKLALVERELSTVLVYNLLDARDWANLFGPEFHVGNAIVYGRRNDD